MVEEKENQEELEEKICSFIRGSNPLLHASNTGNNYSKNPFVILFVQIFDAQIAARNCK